MKTRKMKRFATIAAIAMIASCMAVPFAASAAKVTIVPDGYEDAATHTYTAYQIFTGTFNDKGLQISGWGTGVNHAGLVADADFRTLVGLPTYDSSKVESAAEVAKKLDGQNAKVDQIAAILAKYTSGSGTVIPEVGVDLAVGYYLVTDTYTANTTNDAVSKFILKVADNKENIEITTKKSYPTVVKKVKENKTIEGLKYEDDENYNDVADYSIGETIPFKLYANIPSELNGYESYYIKLTDNLGEQFDLISKANEFVIEVDGVPVKANEYNIHIDTTNKSAITIEIEDIFKLKDAEGTTLDPLGKTITVAYEAALNDNAVIGLPGQINTVDLTYSNNPNEEYAPKTEGPSDDKDGDGKVDVDEDTNGNGVLDEGEDQDGDGKLDENEDADGNGKHEDEDETPNSTDKTQPDKVIVFTYELDTTKVDGADGTALDGAVFKLANAKTGGEYAVLREVTKSEKTYYVVTGWDATGTPITTPDDGIFRIMGVDEGQYWLDEITPPSSYNGLAERLEVSLTANTLDEDIVTDDKGDDDPSNDEVFEVDRQDWKWADEVNQGTMALLDLTVKNGTADVATGIGSVEVENNKGIQLPGTGGIGTTIFYVVGGTMAAGAGVYLISKKRMKKDEE